MAMEDSRVLIWHRDKLKLSIMSEPFLETVFDHILGRDVVKKLMQVTQVRRKTLAIAVGLCDVIVIDSVQVSETMAASNGFLAGNGSVTNGCYDESAGSGPEDKQPMLVVRKNGSNGGNGSFLLDASNGNNNGAGGHGITALINRQLQG